MTSYNGKTVDVRRFLLALFADVAADRNFEQRFKSGHRDIHGFFWRLSKDEETKFFVEELFFDVNGNYPHSSQIDELLQEFQLSGLLARPNPTYRYNDISFASRAYAEDFRKELSPKEQQSYSKILEAFEKELCVRQSRIA